MPATDCLHHRFWHGDLVAGHKHRHHVPQQVAMMPDARELDYMEEH